MRKVCGVPTTTPTRVVLVDDHELMRDGVREVLERTGEFEVVDEAGDGASAVNVGLGLKPDLIIMDVMMPIKDGIEVCREIKGMMPATRVPILTAPSEEDAVMEAVALGAIGFLHKHYSKEQLLSAVRAILAEECRLPDEATKRAFTGVRASANETYADVDNKLTKREREILTLFSQGISYTEIADNKGNSWLTIRNAIYGIQNKLRLQTKQALVVWAMRNRLLDNWEVSN